MIAAANKIRTKPYICGGGHASFSSTGYDCSGSVSFALHGGKFLESPLPSGPMMTWGEEGEGRWITVYANGGHAYMTVAGYRFDTAGDEGEETGPRWHEELRDNEGFVARHPPASSSTLSRSAHLGRSRGRTVRSLPYYGPAKAPWPV